MHGLGFTIMHVCWAGTKYIATLNTVGFIGVSSDGITWTLQAMPFRTTASGAGGGGIVSDGAGKVLWVDSSSALIYTSLDYGVTWSKRAFGVSSTASTSGLMSLLMPSFANSRFFVSVAVGASGCSFLASADLQGWVPVLDAYSPSMTSSFNVMAHKSGVYLFNDALTTACQTLVEDVTKMYLPNGAQSEAGGSNNFLPFIKVQ